MIENLVSSSLDSIAQISAFAWLCAGLLLVTVFLSRRDHKRIRTLQKELKQARSDLKALTTSSLGVGSRILELERHIRQMKLQPQAAPQKSQVVSMPHSNQPYDHAAQLVQQGKSSEEIASLCGISRNEAELIAMMQRLEQVG